MVSVVVTVGIFGRCQLGPGDCLEHSVTLDGLCWSPLIMKMLAASMYLEMTCDPPQCDSVFGVPYCGGGDATCTSPSIAPPGQY